MTQNATDNADIVKVLEGFVARNPNFDGLLSIFKQIEKYLHAIISSKDAYREMVHNWQFVSQLRRLLTSVGLKLIAKDPEKAEEVGVENRLWMKGFYEIFSILRSKAKSSHPDYERLVYYIRDLFKSGIFTFSAILEQYEKLCAKFIINPSELAQRRSDVPKDDNTVISAMYKIYIHLGDLHRYQSAFEPSSSHNKLAIQNYELGAGLLPCKYRAYHNSAIVHRSNKDIISATYNFIRALSLTGGEISRQELLILFDECTKSYTKQLKSFWYHQSRKNQTKAEHFQEMEEREVFKRFSQAFVVLMGIFFTKIGTDCLERCAEDSLVYFQELLKRNSIFLPSLRIVQIIASVHYMIQHIEVKHKAESQPGSRGSYLDCYGKLQTSTAASPVGGISEAQHMANVAVDFGLELFSLMAEHLTTSLRLCDWKNLLMTPMAVGVQLWEGWIRNHKNLWILKSRNRPIFSVRRLLNSKLENFEDQSDDVWAAFVDLVNQAEILVFEFSYLFPRCKTSATHKYSEKIGRLPEYIALDGFDACLNDAQAHYNYYTTPDSDQDLAFLHIRLVRMCDLADFLCGQFDILDLKGCFRKANQYINIAKVSQMKKDVCGLRETDYQFLTKKLHTNLGSMHQMQTRKSKRRNQRTMLADSNNARIILRNPPLHSKKEEPKRRRMINYEVWVLMAEYGYPTELVVSPKRVVLDTNCLIKDLEVVNVLAPYLRYPLLLPVSVILELRGLSRGGLTNKQKKVYGSANNPEAKEVLVKNALIADRCKEILQYFESRWSAFQVVTSTGKFVNPSGPYEHVQDSYFNPEDSNDERILDACKFMEYDDKELRKLDSPLRIFRSTVLLTGDLILSARTITLDIPTRSIASFAQWFFSNFDLTIATRFLWGLEFNANEKYGLRYLAQRSEHKFTDEESVSSDDENISSKARKAKNKQRRRNQRMKGVIDLNPQRFKL